MRFVALALFGVAAALAAAFGSVGHAAAPVPKHLMKEPESDKAKLRGPWKVESMRMGNQELLNLIGQNFEMIIESPLFFAAPAFFFAAISSTPFSRPPTMRDRGFASGPIIRHRAQIARATSNARGKAVSR